MELTQNALNVVRNTRTVRHRIIVDQSITRQTLHKWIEDNDDNLTKAAIVRIIHEETGLNEDQILTEKITVEK